MITLICEGCGRNFEAKHRRQRPHCSECAEELRRKGLGPIQMSRGRSNPEITKRDPIEIRVLEPNTIVLDEGDGLTVNRQLTLTQFAAVLPQWYDIYEKKNPKYFPLEDRITKKAIVECHLDMEDVVEIVKWGGNAYGLYGLVLKRNTDSHVVARTRAAIAALNDPASALSNLLGGSGGINGLGLAFASKVLRCLCPERYGVLDSKLRECINASLLPHSRQEVTTYCNFLNLCHELQQKVPLPGPRRRPGGEWFIADIEMALFEFAWQHNTLM